MYSWNNKTEAISARLMPGLKDRIDFHCQQHRGKNRNRFINDACSFLLEVIADVECGNTDRESLPKRWERYL